jgi:hypothetical protein
LSSDPNADQGLDHVRSPISTLIELYCSIKHVHDRRPPRLSPTTTAAFTHLAMPLVPRYIVDIYSRPSPYLPARPAYVDFAAVPGFIGALERTRPTFADYVERALELDESLPYDALPPRRALRRAMRSLHRERMRLIVRGCRCALRFARSFCDDQALERIVERLEWDLVVVSNREIHRYFDDRKCHFVFSVNRTNVRCQLNWLTISRVWLFRRSTSSCCVPILVFLS